MQNDLGLVQLLLNLEDAIHLVWVLVRLNVGLEGGEGHRVTGGGGVRVQGEELIQHLREDLVSSQGRVLIIANNHSGDALGSRVDVKCEILLLNVLSLSLFRPFGHGLTEHRHEFADAALGEARIAAEIALGAEHVDLLWRLLQVTPELPLILVTFAQDSSMTM